VPTPISSLTHTPTHTQAAHPRPFKSPFRNSLFAIRNFSHPVDPSHPVILSKNSFLLLLPLLLLSTGCAELTFLRDKVQVQESELARLRTDNAEFQKSYYQISQDRASDQAAQQQEVERLRKELDGLRAEVARLDEALQKKTLEADSAQQQLNAQLAQASQSLDKLGDTAARTQVEKEKIESNFNVLSTQIETQRAQLDELQKKYAAEESARKSEEMTRKSTEAALADAAAQLSATKAKVAELSGVQEKANQMSAQIDELKKQPKGLALESDAELKSAANDLTAKLAAVGLTGANVMHDSRGVRIILPSDATFNPKSVTLTPQAESALRVLGDALNAYSSRVIRIEGHTDDQPVYDLPFADNWGLGSARADRVREFLVEYASLRAPHLEMISRGSSDPIADNKSPEGRASNRRVEIVLGAPKK